MFDPKGRSCSCKQGEAKKCEQTAPKTQIRGLCLPAGGSEVWQMSPVHPSPPSLPLSFSLILPSQSPPLTAVSRLLPPTRKASAPLAKMEIDTFSTTTISFLAIFLYAMLRFLNKEVCILIAKEKVVSWLGQVR